MPVTYCLQGESMIVFHPLDEQHHHLNVTLERGKLHPVEKVPACLCNLLQWQCLSRPLGQRADSYVGKIPFCPLLHLKLKDNWLWMILTLNWRGLYPGDFPLLLHDSSASDLRNQALAWEHLKQEWKNERYVVSLRTLSVLANSCPKGFSVIAEIASGKYKDAPQRFRV